MGHSDNGDRKLESAGQSSEDRERPEGPIVSTNDELSGDGNLDITRVADSSNRSALGIRAIEVPGYEILEKLGQGGMGVVYKARDIKLNRIVALKMILGTSVDERATIRFLGEAEAVAAIKHPHVVQVYEYGECEGKPYMVLEYCPAGTLADRIKKGPIATKTAAELVCKLAKGVAAAHEHGIVHRDLKPGNILFDESGEPRIADFGLAKRLGGTEATQTGTLVGSPAYMAPEQISNSKLVGTRADVWAIGAILYECLTGRRPFDAEYLDILYQQILSGELQRIQQCTSGVHRDLELISSKCLSKAPEDRYQSALDLALDLDRFTSGEPVSLRPAGRAERTINWIRRKPTLAATYGLAGLSLLLVGLATGAILLWQKGRIEQVRLDLARKDADGERGKAEAARLNAETSLQREEKLRNKLDRITYLNTVGLSYREWLEGNVFRANILLDSCPLGIRGWEWHYVHKLLSAAQVTFTRHSRIVRPVDFSPDGHRAASADDSGRVFSWATDSGKDVTEFRGHSNGVWGLAYSPDGECLATCGEDGTVRLWDSKTGRPKWKVVGHTGSVNAIAFTPDGQKLVSVAGDVTLSVHAFHGIGGAPNNEAKIWDVQSGEQLIAIPLSGASPVSVACGKFGTNIAIGHFDGTVCLLDCVSGKRIRDYLLHRDAVWGLAFSPDGSTLATVSQSGLGVLWNVLDARVSATLSHPAAVCGVSFSANGQTIFTGGGDGFIRVWDSAGKLVKLLRGHRAHINRVATSRRGNFLLSSSNDQTARVWDLQAGQQYLELSGPTSWNTEVACSPDKLLVASVCRDGSVRFWNTTSGIESFPRLQGCSTEFPTLALSPDGQTVAVSEPDSKIGLWDIATRRRKGFLEGHSNWVDRLAFNSDGSLLASSSKDDTVRIWQLGTSQPSRIIRRAATGRSLAKGVAFSPNEQCLAYADGSKIVILNLHDNNKIILSGHTGDVTSVSFSPNGLHVASSGSDSTVRIWDSHSGNHLFTCTGHGNVVHQVNFSPDGSRLISAAEDCTIRIWLVETGEEAIALRSTNDPVYSATFLPDGNRLVSSGPYAVRMWNASVKFNDLISDTSRLLSIGKSSYRTGDWDDAIAAFREVVRFDPTNTMAYECLSQALRVKRDFRASAAAARELTRLNPSAYSWNNLTDALLLFNEFDEALVTIRIAIKIDPKCAIAHATLAEILIAIGDLDGAVTAGKEAHRLDQKMNEIKVIYDTTLRLQREREAKNNTIAPAPREVKR